MSNIKKKKGQVDITSIVLIILIVILLISIIYSPIKKIIESPLLSPESCSDIQKKQLISITTLCYNNLTKSLDVNITKDSETPIESITFKLGFDNETLKWQCGPNCGNCEVLSRGDKTYHIFPKRIPQTITIVIDSCRILTKEVTSC
jgi:hypothetical protein